MHVTNISFSSLRCSFCKQVSKRYYKFFCIEKQNIVQKALDNKGMITMLMVF